MCCAILRSSLSPSATLPGYFSRIELPCQVFPIISQSNIQVKNSTCLFALPRYNWHRRTHRVSTKTQFGRPLSCHGVARTAMLCANTASFLAIFFPFRERPMAESTRAQLPTILAGLHGLLCNELGIARCVVAHSGTKGDVSEGRWREMLQHHLPARYQVNKAFVIDSKNECSDQIDIVIHDRQFSPFVFKFDSALYVPAESVYAAFEVKQEMSVNELQYAGAKLASVRRLHRTSLPIPFAAGTYPAKPPQPIIGGLLCLKSSWSPAFGEPFRTAISSATEEGRLDLGCAAENGAFEIEWSADGSSQIGVHASAAPLAYFLLRLIARLQTTATVPCLDVMAYAKWLE